MMGVGDGNSEGVGGVGAGDPDAGEEPLDHGVNLRLFGGAGADDGFLDEARGIFGDVDPGAGGEHDDDAACLGELQRRLGILVEEDFLGGGGGGGVVGEEGFELSREVGQALGEGFLGVGLELAVGDVGQAVALGTDEAVAGARQRRVEAEDDQPNFSMISSETS